MLLRQSYYGTEADQYNFYRIPKTLLTDPRYKSVSIEAKVLYGLLLDRMGLSVKNGWMDSEKFPAVQTAVFQQSRVRHGPAVLTADFPQSEKPGAAVPVPAAGAGRVPGFIRIAGEEMAAGVVKSRFLKLNHEHIAYVLDSLSHNTTRSGR